MSHSYVTDTMAIILRLERRRLSQMLKEYLMKLRVGG